MLGIAIELAKMALKYESKNTRKDSASAKSAPRELIPNLPKTKSKKIARDKPVKSILSSQAKRNVRYGEPGKPTKKVTFDESSFIHDVHAERKRDTKAEKNKLKADAIVFGKYEEVMPMRSLFSARSQKLPQAKGHRTGGSLVRVPATMDIVGDLNASKKSTMDVIAEESHNTALDNAALSPRVQKSITAQSKIQQQAPRGILNNPASVVAPTQEKIRWKPQPLSNLPASSSPRGVRFSPSEFVASEHPERKNR